MSRLLLLVVLLSGSAAVLGAASEFGNISIPNPAKPATAEQCVEPVEFMRREHMNLLDHQRDETVHNGDRGSRYSLVGCINCHNPAASGKPIRYPDPEHFCAECHRYASVKIDCFECHADRGLPINRQSGPAWESGLNAATLTHRVERADAD